MTESRLNIMYILLDSTLQNLNSPIDTRHPNHGRAGDFSSLVLLSSLEVQTNRNINLWGLTLVSVEDTIRFDCLGDRSPGTFEILGEPPLTLHA